jgi:hypothetical protein
VHGQLLHDIIGDVLEAKAQPDREAARRAYRLCLEAMPDPKAATPSTPELDRFESLEGEHATAYYRQHEAIIGAQLQIRQDAANQS